MADLKLIDLDTLLKSVPRNTRTAYSESFQPIYNRFGLIDRPKIASVQSAGGGRLALVSDPRQIQLIAKFRDAQTPLKGVKVDEVGRWMIPCWIVDGDPDLLTVIFAGGIDRRLSPRLRDDPAIEILMRIAERSFADVELTGITLDEFDEILQVLAGGTEEQPIASSPPPVQNDWGIPTLDLSLQADEMLSPLIKWGTIARSTKVEGTYHFYTADRKFSALDLNPDILPATGCSAAVEPNYTTTPDMPRALVLSLIYRKRFIAQRWQQTGVKIWVDCNIEREFFDLALLGVPPGWKAYANRAYAADLAHSVEVYELIRAHAGEEPLYLLYGGGKKARQLAEERGWLWAHEDSDVARGRLWDADADANSQ